MLTTEQLDNAEATSLKYYTDCVCAEQYPEYGAGKCYKKLKICLFISKDNTIYLDRFCKKHIKPFLEKEEFKEIIELSIKDLIYLKLIGKYP